MDWARIFELANAWALIWWIALIVGPRGPRFGALVLFAGVGLLALAYAALLVAMLTGAIEGGGGGDFTSLAGVQALMGSDAGLTVGWIHFLALDLFAGLWIANNAASVGVARLIQAPLLLLTLFAGPFGLLVYLILRAARRRGGAKWAGPR
jgi:hypothetical protein